MANTQSSGQLTTPSSGLSKVPSLLAYPKILDLKQVPEIKSSLIYVIKGYKEDGLSIVIHRDIQSGNVYLSIGDWNGQPIDLSAGKHPYYAQALQFAQDESPKFVALMKAAKIQSILIYVSIDKNGWSLVDLRTSLNKFYGPGMIRDLFSKIFPTQETIKIIQLDDNLYNSILDGAYNGSILKSSKFKTITRGKDLLPLYARTLP